MVITAFFRKFSQLSLYKHWNKSLGMLTYHAVDTTIVLLTTDFLSCFTRIIKRSNFLILVQPLSQSMFLFVVIQASPEDEHFEGLYCGSY
jgi:hypothetical protein